MSEADKMVFVAETFKDSSIDFIQQRPQVLSHLSFQSHHLLISLFIIPQIMSQDFPQLGEQLHKSEIHKRIAIAKKNHPDCVPIYFVRHKQSPETLPKPVTPLMLFKRQLRIEEVMYALYQQIQYKGLAFYVLKSEPNNKVRFLMLQPGVTVGKVFDEFSKNDYLALIYHNANLGMRKISTLQRRIIRFAIVIAFIWIALYAVPHINQYFNPTPQAQLIIPPTDLQES